MSQTRNRAWGRVRRSLTAAAIALLLLMAASETSHSWRADEPAEAATLTAERAAAEQHASRSLVRPAVSDAHQMRLDKLQAQRAERQFRAKQAADAAAAEARAKKRIVELRRQRQHRAEMRTAPRADSHKQRPSSQPRAKSRPLPPAPKSCSSYSGNRRIGCTLVLQRGWGLSQMACLNRLWQKESGWNKRAQNPSSGAYGIPQALPGRKMASAGADWRTNAVTQIRWGLGYIKGRYGSPCSAWAHSQNTGWY